MTIHEGKGKGPADVFRGAGGLKFWSELVVKHCDIDVDTITSCWRCSI